MTAGRIDRSSPTPYWAQLRDGLLAQIEAGELKPGDRLPSELELSADLGLSRSTVRQAFAELEHAGLVRRARGRGAFVTKPPAGSAFLQSAVGFFDDAARSGHEVRSKVLRLAVEPLGPWAAGALGLPVGAPGVALERLRYVDGRLVMYALTHLPGELADALDEQELVTGSLYRTLQERRGLEVAGGRRFVDAVNADERLADLLGLEVGTALLGVEAVSWGADSLPFEAYRAWLSPDRARLEISVVPSGALAGTPIPRPIRLMQ